ncbi:hypothetical protein [Synechococcus sp. CCY 0621]|uniref:hypothetical protein n=1 Tax=Synechococcus sp. CCY 0621 TaxID=2815603 RepID=UPI001C235105|nr:hypothetical protein [Synechococcus sp. CCY 0621]
MAVSERPFALEFSKEIIDTSVSQFDIPKACVIGFDPSASVLSLRFQYISDEPAKTLKVDPSDLIGFGRNSHRIASLTVTLGHEGEQREVAFPLLNALKNGTKAIREVTPQQNIPYENHRIISNLLQDNASQIAKFIQMVNSGKA